MKRSPLFYFARVGFGLGILAIMKVLSQSMYGEFHYLAAPRRSKRVFGNMAWLPVNETKIREEIALEILDEKQNFPSHAYYSLNTSRHRLPTLRSIEHLRSHVSDSAFKDLERDQFIMQRAFRQVFSKSGVLKPSAASGYISMPDTSMDRIERETSDLLLERLEGFLNKTEQRVAQTGRTSSTPKELELTKERTRPRTRKNKKMAQASSDKLNDRLKIQDRSMSSANSRSNRINAYGERKRRRLETEEQNLLKQEAKCTVGNRQRARLRTSSLNEGKGSSDSSSGSDGLGIG